MELGRHILNPDYTLKNFALWSLKCPHVQSLCVCMYTCKHKLTWRVNIVGSLLYRLQQKYLFKIALEHIVICVCTYTYVYIYGYVYICVYIYTCIHLCFTKAWIDSGQRKQLMWMKNFHLERPFWMAFCYFTKARFGVFCCFFFFPPLNWFIFISECLQFFISFSQNLESIIKMGEFGFFLTWNWVTVFF